MNGIITIHLIDNTCPVKNKELICIAIAEDHQLVSDGLRFILNHKPHYQVQILASNGKVLLEQMALTEHIPHVCLLDVRMPEMNGIETLALLKEKYPQTKVLMLSQHHHEHVIINSLKRGASGYLLKDATPTELYEAIDTVYSGNHYFKNLLPDYYKKVDTVPKLSEVEYKLIRLICEDLADKEISEKMSTSLRNVHAYKEKLFEKLHVHSKVGVVIYAMQNGLI